MGFFSRSSGRKPYKYGKHGHQHYQKKGMLGKIFRVLESGSHPRHHPQHHRYQPKQETPHLNAAVCSKCHAQIPAGSKFCLECGEKVEMVLFCVSCGERLPSGAKFCSACGKKTSS